MPIESISVFGNNQAYMALIRNPEINKRVKHIDLHYNVIMENEKINKANIEYHHKIVSKISSG